MRHLFIINPVAGGKKNRHAETERDIRKLMDELQQEYEVYITKAPMDACDKIRREAASGEPLRVYACGGDGTLNECVNGAVGFRHLSVTHYPCGTGNDFIKMFGAEETHKFRSLPSLVGGVAHPVDLIEVRTSNAGSRYGINICSVGIDARIGTDVHKYSRIPVIGGATGYVASLIVNLVRGVTQKLNITTGGRTYSGGFTLVCACNGRYYGGGFNPLPDAMPDDGIIDFLIVSGVSRLKFLAVVGKYAKGQYREFSDIITHIRGNNMQIESEKELVINIDGEALFAHDLHFQMIPGGVNFVFPADLSFWSQPLSIRS
jgi:diacylglycerol kinase (ATP)